MTPPRIETARLLLDPLRADDAAALRNIVVQPNVGRMLFLFPADWSVTSAETFIARWQDFDAGRYRLAIRHRGRLIGSVGVYRAEPAARPDIFYFLDPSAAGRGLATEAVSGFLWDVFDRLAPESIGADVFTDNPASARVLEKLGFLRHGHGMGQSAQRVEPASVWLYRLSQADFGAMK